MDKNLERLKEILLKSGVSEKEFNVYINELDKNLKTKNNKYGLVWEEKEEEIYKLLINKYPVLKEITDREIKTDNNNSTNLLIEGDNLLALNSLLVTHKNSIELIYIAPPFNIGKKDFKYNDKYVDKEDTWRHSKWLSFMNKRLRIAKELLTDDGIIFINIDNTEQAQLKLLCDEIFGENNFLDTICWYKGYGRNDSRFFSNSTEYIQCYAKNRQYLIDNNKEFITEKEGFNEVMSIRNKFIKKKSENKSYLELEQEIRAYYKSNPNLRGIKSYNMVEADTLRIYSSVRLEKPKDPMYYYDIIHPVTLKPCKIPPNGWNRPQSSMEILLKNNEVLFGKDEKTTPRRKYYLDEMKYETPKNYIYNSNQGGTEIKNILNDLSYEISKPISLIEYLISLYFKKDITVLDLFGESGVTGHAVLDLNKKDDSNRQFILCANNENNICEEVTYQRLNKVINGYTTPKGKEVEGLGGNLKYYQCDTINKHENDEVNKVLLIENMTEMIKIKSNCYEVLEETNNYVIVQGIDKMTCVIKNTFVGEDTVNDLANKLLSYEHKSKELYTHIGLNDLELVSGIDYIEIPKDLLR